MTVNERDSMRLDFSTHGMQLPNLGIADGWLNCDVKWTSWNQAECISDKILANPKLNFKKQLSAVPLGSRLPRQKQFVHKPVEMNKNIKQRRFNIFVNSPKLPMGTATRSAAAATPH